MRAIPDDTRFCDECKPSVGEPDEIRSHTLTDRARYAFLYSGGRWQRLRTRVIKEQPLCARCELRISEIVDHIVPAGVAVVQAKDSGKYAADKYAGFFFRSNLQGLCRACHAVKTDEDKSHVGPWLDVVLIEEQAPKRRWMFA